MNYKRILFTMAAAVLAMLPMSAQSTVSSYELDVKDFEELKVTDGINVEYFCDSQKAGTVAYESTPELASAIIFTPNGKGKLEISLATRDVKYFNLPTVRVYSNFLTKVENDGDSTVNVLSLKSVPKFEAKLIGNGKLAVNGIDASRVNASLKTGKGSISLKGRANLAKISLMGTGSIDALKLESTDAEVNLVGTGWVKIAATDNLKVSGMGTGTVSFTGNPITRVKALSVKVNRLE